MPIKRAIDRTNGVFTPDDIDVLQRVFDRISEPGDNDDQRDGLASRIIANFQAGIRDEQELLSLSRHALGR